MLMNKNSYLTSHTAQRGSHERGAILYLAVLSMAVILGIVVSVSTITFQELKLLRGIGNSVIAFYAAEAGLERQYFEANPIGSNFSDTLSNGSSYSVEVIDPSDPDCTGAFLFCVKSKGTFRDSNRALHNTF